LITSDTGLFPLKKPASKPTADTSNPEKEIWRRYLTALGPIVPDVLVVHIGSIKEQEVKEDASCDPGVACYANHLGIIGTARIIAMCRPHLAIVSEFGEEMQAFRVPLVRTLLDDFIAPLFEETFPGSRPRAVPGDLALVLDLGGERFLDVTTQDWSPIKEIDFATGSGSELSNVYYFATGRRKRFEEEPLRHIHAFKGLRDGWKSLYFRDDSEDLADE